MHDSTRLVDSTPGAPSGHGLLAFEAGYEDYCEREVDDYLQLDAHERAESGSLYWAC